MKALLPFLEFLVAAGLVLGLLAFTDVAPVFGANIDRDYPTAIMLAVVGLCWGLYSYWGRRWQRSLPQLRPDVSPGGAVATLLDRLAKPQLVTVGTERRLRAGAADAIIEEVSKRPDPLGPPYWLATGQGVLVSLGLIGTFLGLSVGLLGAVDKLQGDPEAMQEGMQALLGGAKLAFVKSLAGVLCAMVWGLRYRRLEEDRDTLLGACKDWLEERYPPVSAEDLLGRLLGEQAAASAVLERRLADMERALVTGQQGILGAIGRSDAQMGQVVSGLSFVGGAVKQSGAAVTAELVQVRQAVAHQEGTVVEVLQATSTAERAQLVELIETVRQLADQLPAQIGPNVGQVIAELLGPLFTQLTEALKKLGDASGETIEGAVERGAGEAVTRLSANLQDVAALLGKLPDQLLGQVKEADLAVKATTEQVVGNLEGAGRAVAGELKVAATDLTAIHDRLNDTVLEVRALTENLATHGQQIQQSLAAAEKSAAALQGHAQGLHDGVVKVTRPLGDVASRLEAVPASVQAANEALRSEHRALSGLGLELKTQAEAVRGQHEALRQRIAEYQQLQDALAGQWQTQMQGVLSANEKVKDAWTTAINAAQQGIESNAQQIATYAKRVEDAVKLPGDLRNLDETISGLTDVLDDLKSTLGAVR